MKESWGRCDKDGNPIWVDRGPGAGVPRPAALKNRQGKGQGLFEDGQSHLFQDNQDADRTERGDGART